jgi:ribokinase
MTGPRIVAVGSINMDIVVRTNRLPRPGETVLGSKLTYRSGGKGANQAVAARRLGALSFLVGCVGQDEAWGRLRDSMIAAGVDISAVYGVNDVTGTALIIVGPDGENMITVAPGANAQLGGPGLAAARPLVETADVLLLQMETPVAAALIAARWATGAGVPILLNVAPLPATLSADLLDLIGLVDILIVNQTEAAGLAAAADSRPPDPDPMRLAPTLLQLGAAEVVVTCGVAGAVLAGNGHSVHVPGFKVAAVDSVGAGDAFCAELAGATASNISDRAVAVERACAAGALTVSRSLGQNGFPTRGDVDALHAAGGPRTTSTNAGADSRFIAR